MAGCSSYQYGIGFLSCVVIVTSIIIAILMFDRIQQKRMISRLRQLSLSFVTLANGGATDANELLNLYLEVEHLNGATILERLCSKLSNKDGKRDKNSENRSSADTRQAIAADDGVEDESMTIDDDGSLSPTDGGIDSTTESEYVHIETPIFTSLPDNKPAATAAVKPKIPKKSMTLMLNSRAKRSKVIGSDKRCYSLVRVNRLPESKQQGDAATEAVCEQAVYSVVNKKITTSNK